jgi:glycosyltransferase involved in cell wall biosynthesis
MSTLRVVIDSILDPRDAELSRYTEELTRALINFAPSGCDVEGIVSASPESDYEDLNRRLPGLSGLHKSSLSRRELRAAWLHGFTASPRGGLIHSTSLLAPFRHRDRVNTTGEQLVVTVSDVIAFTAPHTLEGKSASSVLRAIKRAEKYADAVVVPTHAVAEALAERTSLGDRIRVISSAASTRLALSDDAEERARALGLPATFVLTFASLNPREALDDLLGAMATVETELVVVGNPAWGDRSLEQALSEAQVPAERVLMLGDITIDDLAVVIDRASVVVHPATDESFGSRILDAISLGTAVITSDTAAHREVVVDAALLVEPGEGSEYAERLAGAIDSVVSSPEVAHDLEVAGLDRSRAFTWQSAAEKTWELHAEL